MTAPKKVVLAYSGGLDTSIILKWLQTEYGCEVVTFTADLGQGEELEPARAKAEMMGAKSIYIEDLREEFVRDFVFPMFRANALYEGLYLLGTSIARPLISKRLVEIAAIGTGVGRFVAFRRHGRDRAEVWAEWNRNAVAEPRLAVAYRTGERLGVRKFILEYAELLEVELGDLVFLTEISAPTNITIGAKADVMAESALTVIDLGTQEVTVTVEVRWQID